MAPNVQPLPRSTEAIARWGRNNRSEWSVRQRGDVTEEVLAHYLEASIETALMDRPLTGNIGVRVVDTDQPSLSIYDVFGDPSLNPVEICDGDGICRSNFAYPGVADRSGNLTLFYEMGGFSGFKARLAVNHQSAKVSNFGVAFAKNTLFAAETKADAEASYEFKKGLEVMLQGYNLTDEPNRSYWGEQS